jgi:hypothetical protein
MLINTDHPISSDIYNETKNFIQFNDDYSNSSIISPEFQPIWISVPLISSKYSNYFVAGNLFT